MAQRTTDQPEQQKIAEAILDVLQKVACDVVGLSVRDLQLQLRARDLIVADHRLRGALNQLLDEGKIEKRPWPERRGNVCFNLPGQGILQTSLFDLQISRDEIEREERSGLDLWQRDEAERERATASVMEEIARSHALEENYAKLVHDIASVLADENPVDLILEIADWVIKDLNDLAEKIGAAGSGAQSEIQRLTRELGFRRSKAESFFQRLWRLDRSIRSAKGILDIPTVPQMLRGSKIRFDKEAAKRRLQERIVGNKVIEIITAPENIHKAVVGTDASVGDVMVAHARGSFIPPTPATLFVAAGAMRVLDRSSALSYWDYDLDPRELRQYKDLDAAVEGLLISPHLRREVITDFRHLRSAAMELRQYAEELRIVLQQSKWHPISGVPEIQHPPTVTLLIRDGRIFPLVHRLDDYDGASAPDDILYGEVVRREIRTFQRVFHNTAGNGRLGAIYGGAVKSPEYSWLAMITFWYLHIKQGHPDLVDAFYRPPLNDQAVTHLLFWGLAESKPDQAFGDPRNSFVTFRALRRFSDIAFFPHPRPLTDDSGKVVRTVQEDNIDDWLAYIQQHINEANQRYDQHKRGIPALTTIDDYKPFLDLCHRAGVAMFYAAPARMYRATLSDRAHFFTPRWEIAVDLTNKDIGEEIKRRLEGLMAWLVEQDGLVADESHAVGGFEEVAEGLPLFIPNVVMEAHRAVGYGRERHAMDVQDDLQKLVTDIRAGRLGSVNP
ncbi:hypothetical protein [Caldilinea sp.]|uniref:hypothetical protein n=1 Tax=Caldilinea sp. TaxID=2293560 RepID=UPI0021DE6008|nr:hypothetical protein [Caldilinea sp.]GIK72718.1 MAG: hypothetical protein BroJett021_17060 [Chloroflexota bacterium]GIV68710.1 MAG: hypothetical protein KatS3mg048_1572 [Caldilinea sp.]